MKGFAEHLARDRRLVILRLLAEAAGYAANESILHSVLENFGHHVARDTVRGDLTWLDEQSLVTLETVAGDVMVARITARGMDIAAGRARHPGVKKPGP